MGFGCGGCLSMLVILAAAVSVGMTWTIARCLGQPDVPIPAASAAESRRAQQKLAEMFQRPRSSASPLSDPIVFSEGEINALLARNVEEIRGTRLRGSVVRLIGSDHVDIYRSFPMTRVLDAVGLGEISRYLPSAWRERAVWWRISTRVRNTSRPDGRRLVALDVEALALGNQPLPSLLARVLLDPKLLDTLSFELPGGVESIAVEPGRALVRRAASAGWRHRLPLAQGAIAEMVANLHIGSAHGVAVAVTRAPVLHPSRRGEAPAGRRRGTRQNRCCIIPSPPRYGHDRVLRDSLRTSPRYHGSSARPGWVPVGPRAEPPLPQALSHRGGLRGPGGNRER